MKRQTTEQDRFRSKSYRKEIIQQTSGSKIKDKVVDLTTNISYSIGGSYNKLKNFFTSSSNKQHVIYYVHGKKFANEEQVKNEIKKMIWFSYRRIPGLSKTHHSDTGWGCLIRVGQMALAAGLKKCLQMKKGQKFLTYQEVVIAFVQSGGRSEKYSLKKIVQCGKKKFDLDYGSWFNPLQICEVLVSLHKKDPMKDTQNLQIHHFKNSAVYVDTILCKLQKPMCNCTKRRILCETCLTEPFEIKKEACIQSFSSSLFYQPKKEVLEHDKMRHTLNASMHLKKNRNDKNLLLFVTARLGLNEIKQQQYEQLLQLLKLDCSLGIVGGVPKKGYYFVGCSDTQLIYMDPHLAQDEVTLNKLNQSIRTFQNNQLRKVGRKSIDPSMAFVFYIDGLQSLRQFHSAIQDLEKYNDPIMTIGWENQFMTEELRIEEEDDEMGDLDNSFIGEI